MCLKRTSHGTWNRTEQLHHVTEGSIWTNGWKLQNTFSILIRKKTSLIVYHRNEIPKKLLSLYSRHEAVVWPSVQGVIKGIPAGRRCSPMAFKTPNFMILRLFMTHPASWEGFGELSVLNRDGLPPWLLVRLSSYSWENKTFRKKASRKAYPIPRTPRKMRSLNFRLFGLGGNVPSLISDHRLRSREPAILSFSP